MTAQRYPVSIKGVMAIEGRIPLLFNERREWELPGGRLEPDERPEQALVREVAEEMEPCLEGAARRELPGMLAKTANAIRSKNTRGAQSLDERADALRLLVGGTLAQAPAAARLADQP